MYKCMELRERIFRETRVDKHGIEVDIFELIWENGDITYDLIPSRWGVESCSNCCNVGWYKECQFNNVCQHYEEVPIKGNPFYERRKTL